MCDSYYHHPDEALNAMLVLSVGTLEAHGGAVCWRDSSAGMLGSRTHQGADEQSQSTQRPQPRRRGLQVV